MPEDITPKYPFVASRDKLLPDNAFAPATILGDNVITPNQVVNQDNGQPIGATPGGSDTQIQFNDGGSFGGSPLLTFDKSVGGDLSLASPDGSGSGQGGTVAIIAGAGGSTGIGGNIDIEAGPGNDTKNGGQLYLQSGNAAGSGVGGNVDIDAGGSGDGDGGQATLKGGSGATNGGGSTGNGGSVYLLAGTGVGTGKTKWGHHSRYSRFIQRRYRPW